MRERCCIQEGGGQCSGQQCSGDEVDMMIIR